MKKEIYLYTDEAGNTGPDLFNDSHQPFFYTATIFSAKDIDTNENIQSDLDKILQVLRQNNPKIREIHFTELTEDEKSFITNEMVDILNKHNLELLVSIIEKKYLPKLLFINEFFDSGINPTVPLDVYNIRIHRMFLVFGITQKFTDEDSKIFYQLFRSMNKEKIITFIHDIKPRLLKGELAEHKALIDRALTYVVENIDKFIYKLDKKYLLPNYHVLNLIMHYTRDKYGDSTAIFKHDHNSNILKGFTKKLLPISLNWDADMSDFSSISDIKRDDTFKNGISFIDSKKVLVFKLQMYLSHFLDCIMKEKLKIWISLKKLEIILITHHSLA